MSIWCILPASTVNTGAANRVGMAAGCVRVCRNSETVGIVRPEHYDVMDKNFSPQSGFVEVEVKANVEGAGCVSEDRLSLPEVPGGGGGRLVDHCTQIGLGSARYEQFGANKCFKDEVENVFP